MPASFNPYLQWLDLPPETVRPSHYELLGLPTGEGDSRSIALAAEQAATKVRSFRPGSHASDWARLLDEIQAAKVVLLDPARKAQYDRQLPVNGRGAEHAAASNSPPAPKPLAPNSSDLFPPGFRPSSAAPDAAPAPAPATASAAASPMPVQAAPPAPVAVTEVGSAWPEAYPPGVTAPVPAYYPVAGNTGAFPPAYSMPVAQPVGYSAVAGGYPTTMAPVGVAVAMPTPASPTPIGAGGLPYGVALPTMPYARGAAIDPMAPVAIPGVSVPTMASHAMGMPMVPYGMLPQAVLPAPAAPMAAPGETGLGATPQVHKASAAGALLAARKDKQTRHAALLAGAAAGLVVVAGLVGYVVITARLNESQRQQKIAQASDAAKTKQHNDQKPVTVPSGASRPDSGGKSNSGDAKGSKPSDAENSPMPVPMVEPEPMPTPEPKPEAKLEPMPPPTPTPEPKAEPAPPVKLTRQQVVELQAALKKARVALSEHTFDEAEADIAKAEKLALLSNHQALVQRLRLATEHVKLFREALSEAVGKLEAAETIKVGSSTVVAIVETFPDKIIVRVNGMNRNYSLSSIPQGLANAILDAKRLGGQPDSRVLKAMFVATGKDADEEAMATARRWLTEAQASDTNAAALLKFLDDSYDNLVKEFDAGEKSAAASAKTAAATN